MANSPNYLAGTASINADGQNFALVGDFTYKLSGVDRETIGGLDGIHGFKGTIKEGEIKAKIRNMGGLSVGAIGAMENVTVIAQLVNGKTVVGRNMWVTERPPVDGGEATVDVTWQSADVVEA